MHHILVVVDGNQRTLACRLLGVLDVPLGRWQSSNSPSALCDSNATASLAPEVAHALLHRQEARAGEPRDPAHTVAFLSDLLSGVTARLAVVQMNQRTRLSIRLVPGCRPTGCRQVSEPHSSQTPGCCHGTRCALLLSWIHASSGAALALLK